MFGAAEAVAHERKRLERRHEAWKIRQAERDRLREQANGSRGVDRLVVLALVAVAEANDPEPFW